MFLLRLFRTLKHLEQLIQFRSHDDFCTTVFGTAVGSFVVVDRHEFATAARLYLQRLDTVVFCQDADDRGSADDTEIPVIFELGGVDRLAVGVSFDIHVDIGLLVEDSASLAKASLPRLSTRALPDSKRSLSDMAT